MTIVARPLALLLVLGSIAACTPALSPQQRIDAQEMTAVTPLRAKYAPAVDGLDVKGDTLVVGVDLQGLSDMDELDEVDMKHDILSKWRAAWIDAHPNAHATIHVQFLDFRGNQESAESVKV
jgi:hypothetical protein